jgi:outer membrane protein assembly factor BamD (BamD/ComL family)
MKISFFCVFSFLLITACETVPVVVPATLSPAEIIQRAQEATDRNRYKTALKYYQTLVDRNRTNIDLTCAGEYEIAFIHYKQKRYDLARKELGELLEKYNTPDEELLPAQYKKLANIVLARITEKQKPKNFLGNAKE